MRKFHFNIIILFFLYASLLIGFFYGEDLNGGAKGDFLGYLTIINFFNENFKETFLNYDKFGDRHSPLTVILLSQLLKFDLNEFFIRFLNLNLCLVIIIIFYKCLKIIYKDVDKYFLQLLCFVIFLSPTFRALSIWPDSRIHGLLFFILSLFYFIKFSYIEKKNKYVFLNSFFLVLSSYFSPNFSVFFIYFFWNFFSHYKFNKVIIFYFIFNLILSIPMLYYLFFLDVFFLSTGITPNSENYNHFGFENISNKFLIITSLIFFI